MILREEEWATALEEEFQKAYYMELMKTVEDRYERAEVFPPKDEVFAAFHMTPLSKVRVVILGQDPYHDVGQAEGLSFSVKKGVKIPKSLVNIYKELKEDVGCDTPSHGSLVDWAKQGVLLLNTVLTVEAHAANSHKGIGWEKFTDAVIRAINEEERPIVFILWGKPAQSKGKMLNNNKHFIIETPHPSPLSSYRGFFGSKVFSRANAYLEEMGEAPIRWAIEE